MITLLGAEFSCVLGLFRDEETIAGGDSRSDLLLAYRLLEELWKAQRNGDTLSAHAMSDRLGRLSVERIEGVLMELKKHQMVLRSDNRHWALARNLAEVTLHDLYRLRPYTLPVAENLPRLEDPSCLRFADLLTTADARLAETLGETLDALFSRRDEKPNGGEPVGSSS
jgi:membrane protein